MSDPAGDRPLLGGEVEDGSGFLFSNIARRFFTPPLLPEVRGVAMLGRGRLPLSGGGGGGNLGVEGVGLITIG